MSSELPVQDETARKRRTLRRKRGLATGLLLLGAAVFIGAQFARQDFGLRLAAAAAEAALVGGLADWFAVTALFRRPLGLPIPHTALIPSRKDELGRSLGNFVRDNFLDPPLVIERLRAENRAVQLAHWLDSARAADFVAERVLDMLPLMLKGTDDRDLRRFIGAVAQAGLKRLDIAPIADAAIAAVIESGKHMQLLDGLADVVDASLGTLKSAIVAKVGERTGRFFPKYFDDKIGKGIVAGARAWLTALRLPGSDERLKADYWIRARVADFRAAPEYHQVLRDAQAAVLSNPALMQALEAVWDELKHEIADDLERDAPQIGAAAARAVRRAGVLLRDTPSIQQAVNAGLEGLVVDYIAPWRAQISDFIAEVVQSWDAHTVTELIELEVGADLQYVRINGTVVGALIGMLLFLISAGLTQIR
jgi:uncharacterized membrane-anchored protein YjiN (DUF445 family)